MYILIKNLFYVYIHMYTKFSVVHQEILMFYYFKNSIKSAPIWKECIFRISEKKKTKD